MWLLAIGTARAVGFDRNGEVNGAFLVSNCYGDGTCGGAVKAVDHLVCDFDGFRINCVAFAVRIEVCLDNKSGKVKFFADFVCCLGGLFYDGKRFDFGEVLVLGKLAYKECVVATLASVDLFEESITARIVGNLAKVDEVTACYARTVSAGTDVLGNCDGRNVRACAEVDLL